MDWDWAFTLSIMPQLIDGVIITIQVTLLGTVVAMVMGLAWAILRRSPNRPLAAAVRWTVEFIRGTPLLVQLYFLFYILPDIGILLSPLTAGVIGLGLHYSAYTAEVYRAGIENVPKGQWEAAKAVNLSRRQTWSHIIIPQAIPPMIPALANYFVAMFKETPLLSATAATFAAFAHLGVRRVSLLTPYIEPVTEAMRDYFETHDLDVVNSVCLGIEDDRMMARLSKDAIVEAALATMNPEAEALFISCTAVRAADVAERIEAKIKKPVVTSNQAMAWRSLRLAGCDRSIAGFGKLLQ